MPPTRLRFEESQHDDAHEESQYDDASTRVAVGQPRANEEEEFSPPVGHTDRHGGVSTDVQIDVCTVLEPYASVACYSPRNRSLLRRSP